MIKDDQYKKFNDFKTRVLDIAKREINSKTDIKIDFKLIKAGRKVEVVEFDIKSKGEKIETPKELYCINNKKDPKHVKEIMQFGFSASQAADMLDRTNHSDVENAIKAVKNQIKKGNAKNPKAMIKIALKEKWHDTDNENNGEKAKDKKLQKSKNNLHEKIVL